MNTSSDVAQVRHLWRRWEHVVAYFSRHKGKRKPMSPEQYRALHGALLATCQSGLERGDSRTRPMFERIQAVATPWITLDSLSRAHKAILLDLLDQCDQAERLLSPHRTLWRWVTRASLVAVALVAVAAVWQAAALANDGLSPSSLLADARSLAYRIGFAVQRASFLEKFGALAVMIVLVGMGLLGSMRKY